MSGMRGPAAVHVGKTPKVAHARVVVPFEDNRHLSRLLGEYDGHLALIEDRLGIEAHVHGNVVTLSGPAEACATAREVLEKLYARVRAGDDIAAGDVDGLLRHIKAEPGGKDQGNDQLPQIRTRRKVITARSPNQSAYVQALERSHGNQTHAGHLLGINRDQVRYRIEKFGLMRPGQRAADDSAAVAATA